MMRVRELRFLTVLSIVGMAGLAIKPAIELVGFGLAQAVSADPAKLATYRNTPGAGSLAREAILRRTGMTRNAERMAIGLLARRPLSANDWLGLARIEILGRSDLRAGLLAAAMSEVTGPNEGGVMAGRVALLLPLWSLLTPDMRRSEINDLANGWGLMTAEEQQQARAAVRIMAPDQQANLRAGLLLSGKQGERVEQAVMGHRL